MLGLFLLKSEADQCLVKSADLLALAFAAEKSSRNSCTVPWYPAECN